MATKQEKFFTKYDRPEHPGETNDGPLITSDIHVDTNDLIREFRDAGLRLQDHRAAFHDPSGKDNMEDFVPLNPGADPIEAQEYAEAVSAHIEEVVEDAKRKQQSETAPETGSPPEAGTPRNKGGNGDSDLSEGAGS